MLKVGQVLDEKYQVIRLVGEGGMGSVFEAQHVFLGRRVAIKVLSAEFAHNIDAVRRFYREAQAAAHIGHENICEVTDVGQTDGSPYIVMQLMHGKSLAQAIVDSAPFPVGRTVDIGQQTLEALAAAHAAGIVHRDMKPDNVFLTRIAGRDDFVKLLDFGISKIRLGTGGTNLTQAGTIMGTPQYMSPEQARGETDVDGRADIWAVGVIVYQMLTGRVPFEGDNYNKIIFSVVSAPIPPMRSMRQGITPELEAAVAQAMERDVDRRFGTALEFRDALLGAWMSVSESGFAVKAATIPPPRDDDATEISPFPAAKPSPRGGGVVIGTSIPMPEFAPKAGGVTVPHVFVAEVPGSTPASPIAAKPAVVVAEPSRRHGTVEATPRASVAGLTPTTIRVKRKASLYIAAAVAGASVLIVAAILIVRAQGGSNGAGGSDTLTTTPAPPPASVDAESLHASAVPTTLPVASLAGGSSSTSAEHTKPAPEPSSPPLPLPPPPVQQPAEPSASDAPGAMDALSQYPLDLPSGPRPPTRDAGRSTRDATASQAPATGTLAVATSPWTNVFIDGTFFARAPFTGRPLPAGSHSLRFVNEAADVNLEETVTVAAGETTSIRRTASQLGANTAATAFPSWPDARGGPSGPPDAAQPAADAVRFRTDVYRRDAP